MQTTLALEQLSGELAAAAASSKNPAKAVIAKILKAGYLPTKVADSFAIASGGATYYRNAIKMYEKQGLSKAEAERKAFIDFQAIAERTQQSSRADLISKQQTTFGGRLILPFANTPMQMNRLALKEMLDISKGRYKNAAELTDKLGKIGYYGFIQTAIFAGLGPVGVPGTPVINVILVQMPSSKSSIISKISSNVSSVLFPNTAGSVGKLPSSFNPKFFNS